MNNNNQNTSTVNVGRNMIDMEALFNINNFKTEIFLACGLQADNKKIIMFYTSGMQIVHKARVIM